MAAFLQKGSKSHSIFFVKCPRCQESRAFETGSWSFVKGTDMRKRCPVCDLDYEPEPGYYYGSMFISYIWTAFFSLIFVAIFHWILGLGVWTAMGALGIFIAINFIYIFRISRMMWLNIHVKYDPKFQQQHKH
ncbi:MAG: DUF983 domain-containing protein [Chitinophagales bacterium]|nr:DUF983 domain-containing protein [Chitinophagales bacterium]